MYTYEKRRKSVSQQGNRAVIQLTAAADIFSGLLGKGVNSYHDFQNDAGLGATSEYTYGVELEVLHKHDLEEGKNIHIKKSIAEARTAGVTDASDVDQGSSDKWRPTTDATVEAANYDGIEWVSPVMCLSKECWDSIEKLTGIIIKNRGTIKDSCSEHIHVGNAPLELDTSKYDNLFRIYAAFSDLIDIIARCQYKQGDDYVLREGVNEYAALNMGESPLKGMFHEAHLKKYLKTESTSTAAAYLLSLTVEKINKVEESHCNTLTNLETSGKDFDLVNNFITEYSEYAEALKNLFEFMKENQLISEDLVCTLPLDHQNLSANLPKIKRSVFLNQLLIVYNRSFTGNVTGLADERYRAVNINQMFNPLKSKPTVEFRRFNGTISAQAIQANVLLSTAIMNAAANRKKDEVDEAVTESRSKGLKDKIAIFLDFLIGNDNDAVKTILTQAFIANLNKQETE